MANKPVTLKMRKMNRILPLFTFLLLLSSCVLDSEKEPSLWTPEQITIQNTLKTAYAEGLQNEGDSLKIDAHFHPQFTMIARKPSDSLRFVKLRGWRAAKIKARAEGKLPLVGRHKVSIKFQSIDIAQDVAVAKVDYYEGERLSYIDFISLYKIKGEWKIISKVFTKIEE